VGCRYLRGRALSGTARVSPLLVRSLKTPVVAQRAFSKLFNEIGFPLQ
jgi:hypothetical protein